MYFVINMDVKSSKNTNNRQVLQDNLSELCKALNQMPCVVSLFDIVLGDEIQGMIKAETTLIDLLTLVDEFERDRDLILTKGIGYGPIETLLNTEDVEKNDGPVFHDARQAIILAKKRGYGPLIIHNQNFESVQNMWNFYIKLKNSESKQASLISGLLDQGMNQKDIARQLNTKPSSISRTITRYNIVELQQLKKSIFNMLKMTLEVI